MNKTSSVHKNSVLWTVWAGTGLIMLALSSILFRCSLVYWLVSAPVTCGEPGSIPGRGVFFLPIFQRMLILLSFSLLLTLVGRAIRRLPMVEMVLDMVLMRVMAGYGPVLLRGTMESYLVLLFIRSAEREPPLSTMTRFLDAYESGEIKVGAVQTSISTGSSYHHAPCVQACPRRYPPTRAE